MALLNPGMEPPPVPSHYPQTIGDPQLWGPGGVGNSPPSLAPPVPLSSRRRFPNWEAEPNSGKWQLGTSCSSKVRTSTVRGRGCKAPPGRRIKRPVFCFLLFCSKARKLPNFLSTTPSSSTASSKAAPKSHLKPTWRAIKHTPKNPQPIRGGALNRLPKEEGRPHPKIIRR